jgi:1-phosphofructokinase
VLKPNEEELSEVTGVVPETFGDVVFAANQLRQSGVGTVVVSLGPAGAVLVGEGEALHAECDVIVPRSTVGAGDALLAGFLAAGGEGAEALTDGVAWGTAACVLPGTAVPGPADIRRVLVRTQPVDPERPVGLADERRRRPTRA